MHVDGWRGRREDAKLTRLQFPAKEVKEFEAQLLEIQDQLQFKRESHEGKTAEEVYAERLAKLSLTEGEPADGPTVVRALLARCLLWCEIVQDKYATPSVKPVPSY